MAQGDKGRELHRLAAPHRTKRQQILPRNQRNPKRAQESNTKERAISKSQTHNMGTTGTVPSRRTHTSQLTGKKVRDVFTRVYGIRETVFSNQTGWFPMQSQQGNKYILVMVKIDSNAILVEPISSRNDHKLARAYRVLMTRLQHARIVPKKHILDNEVSEAMKTIIKDEYKMAMELVSPGCHRRNAVEVTI